MDKATTLKTLHTMLIQTPMTKKDICEKMWLQEPQVEKLLAILKDEGKVVYVNNVYTGVVAPIKKRVKKSKRVSHNPYITIIRLFLGLIGFAATVLSIRYTAIFLLEVLPVFWAWYLSSIMVLFSVLAFQIIVVFYRKKRLTLAITCGTLWVIVMLYSMGSTVIGQYNARKETFSRNSVAYELVDVAKSKEEIYVQEERLLLDRLDARKQDLARYNKLISAYDTVEKRDADRRSYNSLATAIAQANTEIKGIVVEISELRSKRIEIVGDIVKEAPAPNFYEWIASLFMWNPAMVEFLISIIPAIWIDIIAPLGVALGIFLKEDT